MKITIFLKSGEVFVAECKNTMKAKNYILKGNPSSGLTGLVWNYGDGTYRDIKVEEIQTIK